ncbi:MAG TPA: FkbM family methyltransferase, partial [Acidobacteriota bacterium]|nr:FkbM family methyltransferase [Acidobacteriota bacterium]HQM64961.1 FkbM family methyltransferase [Acidobacteriota bacterium]
RVNWTLKPELAIVISEEAKVRMTTVSKFCQEMNINKIEILKIDTEGYDLEVLKGADDLLQSQSIDLVQTEVGISSTNNYHVPFQIINQFLIERNYYVFGIYNQELEWPTSEPRLRRVDVVYISENALRSNMSLDN